MTDMTPAAIADLYPEAERGLHWQYGDEGDGLVVFTEDPDGFIKWDEDLLGAYDSDAVKARAVELAQAVPLPDLEPYQFHSMLEIAGIKAQVETAIDELDMPGALVMRERYNRTVTFRRDDPIFAALGPAVGLTGPEIDALWAYAVDL